MRYKLLLLKIRIVWFLPIAIAFMPIFTIAQSSINGSALSATKSCEQQLDLAKNQLTTNLDSSKFYAFRAYQCIGSNPELAMDADILELLGKIYWRTTQADSARHYYLKALEIYTALQDTIKMAIQNIRIAGTLLTNDIYDKAAEYYFESRKLFESQNDLKGMLTVDGELGILNKKMGYLDKAKEYYQRSMANAKVLNDSVSIFYVSNNIGSMLTSTENYDSALVYYETSYSYTTKNQLRERAVLKSNMSTIYIQQGRLDKALDACKQSEYFFNQTENKLGLSDVYVNWGIVLKEQGDIDQAVKFNDRAIQIASLNQRPENIKVALDLRIELAKTQRNYREALQLTAQYDSISQLMLSKEKDEIVKELELKYNREKDQAQLAALTIQTQNDQLRIQKSNIQKISLISLLTLAGILLGFVIWQLRQKRMHNSILQKKNLQIENSLQENQYLLKEIHHRVKNNLQIISSLLDIQSREIPDPEASKALKQSVHRVNSIAQIHQSLYQTKSDQINIQTYLTDLVSRLDDSYGGQEEIACSVSGDTIQLKRDDVIYLGMIMNEIVSNAYKHAFNQVEKGVLKISIHQNEDSIEVLVKDNGPGFDPAQINKGSLGIDLINMFSQKLKGKHHWKTEEGSIFSLTFPIK